MNESWKQIAGFGFYEASNLGEIRSWRKKPSAKDGGWRSSPRLLTPCNDASGYPVVNVFNSDLQKMVTVRVSRLVLLAFSGRPEKDRDQAAHANGIRTDNRIENLRWATRSENERDKVVHGTSNRGERCGGSKIDADSARRIYDQKGMRSAKAVGSEFGLSENGVYGIWSGKNWSHATGAPCPEK